MNVVFLGFGYSAKASAEALSKIEDDLTITGTSRAPNMSAGRLAFDGTQRSPELGAALQSASTHIISSIAPDASGDPTLRYHRDDILKASNVEWLCYFSTVGVYGDHDGGWVDESRPLTPQNARSQWRVAAEAEWQAVAEEKDVPLCILRLAGIYGPGRSALDKLQDGTATRVVKPGQVFNRIHVADIGRITALAAQRRLAGVYNLSDDEPAPPQDLITVGADLLGLEPPPPMAFEDAEMSPMARGFYADNKRVSNRAIKQALGIELLYPNYRDGLNAILPEE